MKQAGTTTPSIKISNLFKNYGAVQVLRNISLNLTGEISVAITGPSGSGKSTLLHVIGTLEKPDNGRVEINNTDPFTLSEPELARYRNTIMGLCFRIITYCHNIPCLRTFLFRHSPSNRSLMQHNVPRNSSNASDSHTAYRIVPVNFLAVNGNASPSRAPLSINRVFCFVMNPRVTWMTRLPVRLPTSSLNQHRVEQNMLIVITHDLEFASRFQQRLQLTDGTGRLDKNS